MIEIDGSHGEGGGQLVRTALALSMLTQQPFRMTNIRKGRSESGLKAQHVAAIHAFQAMSDCTVSGAELGSETLVFLPAPITKTSVEINIGTAGSITLLLQALLLPCSVGLGKPITLSLRGGTDVQWSMSIDYLREIVLPRLEGSLRCKLELLKRGYYPKGEGFVKVTIKKPTGKKQRMPLMIDKPGMTVALHGISHASQDLQQSNVAERQALAARIALQHLGLPVDIQIEYRSTACTGSGITLWAKIMNGEQDWSRIGADSLGTKGVSAEHVGSACAKKLLAVIASKAPVDQHLADNLIPWMALARPSSILVEQITEHTRSNIAVVEQFLPVKFKIEGTVIRSE